MSECEATEAGIVIGNVHFQQRGAATHDRRKQLYRMWDGRYVMKTASGN